MAQAASKPTIATLAQRIAQDIRTRGLQPGEQYIGTAEAARMLSVSTTAANRAMQLLAKQRVVVRRQRKGTFIAEPAGPRHERDMQRIHLLVREDYLRKEGLLNDGLVIGMQHVLPGVDMQYNFLRGNDADEQVAALIDEALTSKLCEGFLATRSSLTIQRMLAGSGLPTVLLGSPHPSIDTLPWIDRDHYEIGRLLVEQAASRGCRRILLLQRDTARPGDFGLYDGVVDTLAAAGFAADALTVRNLSDDAPAVAAVVEQVARRYGEPTAIIARSRPLADAAVAIVASLRAELGCELLVTAAEIHVNRTSPPPEYPYAEMAIDAESIGRHIGRMFHQLAHGLDVVPSHEIIPVQLRDPTTGGPPAHEPPPAPRNK